MAIKSEACIADIVALLRARNPLIWVVTREEARAERGLCEAAAAAGYIPRMWDAAQGVTGLGGDPASIGSPSADETLNAISERARGRGNRPARTDRGAWEGVTEPFTDRGVWIMRDLAPWLTGAIGIVTCRALRNLARLLPSVERSRAQAVIVLSPTADIPAELQGHTTVIDWPLPDRDEIAAILDAAIGAVSGQIPDAAPNGTRDAAIDAALGLSDEEASACYSRSLVQLRRIDPVIVSKEKRRVIARERILEWFEPLPGGLDAVGGLDALKSWLIARRAAYTPQARAYGLPAPKGVLLVGVQGCGKSLTAKAIATAWQVPLLRVDLGALKSKFVGESEGNLRRALGVIEAIGRCVVWLDEIEKSLAGATQGAADGGVSADALGTILSWLQERAGEAFIVATSNDVSQLPPELLRKGRFDELWFVDLPNEQERGAILEAALRAHKRDEDVNVQAIAEVTDRFIGAEIAALVPEALYAAYADNARQITTLDLVTAARRVVPLSKTMKGKIEALREWAQGRARPATTSVEPSPTKAPTGRVVDL